jgi:hypothetical protein
MNLIPAVPPPTGPLNQWIQAQEKEAFLEKLGLFVSGSLMEEYDGFFNALKKKLFFPMLIDYQRPLNLGTINPPDPDAMFVLRTYDDIYFFHDIITKHQSLTRNQIFLQTKFDLKVRTGGVPLQVSSASLSILCTNIV